MRLTVLFSVFALLPLTLFAQQPKPAARTANAVSVVDPYATIDKLALAMPDSLTHTTAGMATYINAHFQTELEKTRAIFIWEVNHIRYDVDNMYAINFYEKEEDLVRKPLDTHLGICANYAALFNDLCAKTGVTCFEVVGYTKQHGRADYIPHAWCMARIDTSWFGFDPTFGAGYVTNNKFVPAVTPAWYKMKPLEFVNTHMPFDYLWQCLYYPITHTEFYAGKPAQPNASKPFFYFPDSIAAYAKSSRQEQMKAELRRINENGVKNSLLFDRLQHLASQLEAARQANYATLYNSAVYHYNDASSAFTKYVNYYNQHFTPAYADSVIRKMLDDPARDLQVAKAKLAAIQDTRPDEQAMINSLDKAIDETQTRVQEQREWLKKYFAKSKFGRRNAFVKYTWFGVPLN